MFDIFKCFLLSLLLLLSGCNSHIKKQQQKSKEVTYQTFYDEITLEVVCVEGFGPDAKALAFFVNKLNQYDIARVVNIQFSSDVTNVFPIWNTSLIRSFEKINRKLHDPNPKDRHLILFICYLPGIYIQGDKTTIAGLQYADTSFAIFRERTDASYEGVVLLHELGHIMKIAQAENRKEDPVNPERPNHCNNRKCTMFWRAGEHRTELDAECLAELRALIAERNHPTPSSMSLSDSRSK